MATLRCEIRKLHAIEATDAAQDNLWALERGETECLGLATGTLYPLQFMQRTTSLQSVKDNRQALS